MIHLTNTKKVEKATERHYEIYNIQYSLLWDKAIYFYVNYIMKRLRISSYSPSSFPTYNLIDFSSQKCPIFVLSSLMSPKLRAPVAFSQVPWILSSVKRLCCPIIHTEGLYICPFLSSKVLFFSIPPPPYRGALFAKYPLNDPN